MLHITILAVWPDCQAACQLISTCMYWSWHTENNINAQKHCYMKGTTGWHRDINKCTSD